MSGRRITIISVFVTLVAALALSAPALAAPSTSPQCPDPFSAAQQASNPLLLASAPGANPLGGIGNLFVNGPAHGAAAGAIARLLGYDTNLPAGAALPDFLQTETWQQFLDLTVDPKLPFLPAATKTDVLELEKIAAEPEVERVSSYSQGGGYAGVYSQTQKLFCGNFHADPGTVPIINTYFLHALLAGCATKGQILAKLPLFEQLVNGVHDAIGNRPVVLLLESDGIGSSSCMSRHHSLKYWLQAIRYEVDTLAALPHAVIYVEAGYSDGNSPSYTAKALNQVDITKIRGFYTNDTHLNWTINEIHWGDRVSALTKGHPHFIVNTAQNGNGPLVPHNRKKNGNEVLCNPSGRALGPKPTTSTGFPLVDAFLWTSVPGNSSGSCNGGPASGSFWTARAVQLAEAADNRLGPGASQPY